MKLAKLAIALILCFVIFSAGADAGLKDLKQEAEKVGRNMKKYLSSTVEFADQLSIVYKKNDLMKDYMKFDTKHVRCRISLDKKKDIELIKTLMEEEIQPQLVHITGTVVSVMDYLYFCEVETVKRVSYDK